MKLNNRYTLNRMLVVFVVVAISVPAFGKDVTESMGDLVFFVTTDPIDDEQTFYLSILEESSSSSILNDRSSLTFICSKELPTILGFHSSEFLPFLSLAIEGDYVTYDSLMRFDREPVRTIRNWRPLDSNDVIANNLEKQKFESILDETRNRRKLAFRTTDANGKQLTVIFDLTNSAPMVDMFRAACKKFPNYHLR